MREEIVKVYKFEELSDEAKEKAREWWRNSDVISTDSINDAFIQVLEEKGYTVNAGRNKKHDIYWSLQDRGEFVAFAGYGDVEKILERLHKNGNLTVKEMKHLKWIQKASDSFGVRVSYQHYGGGSMGCSGEFDEYTDYNDDSSALGKLIAKVTELVEEDVKDVCGDLVSLGNKEIEYQMSDEVVDENLTLNEYEFTEKGKYWTGA